MRTELPGWPVLAPSVRARHAVPPGSARPAIGWPPPPVPAPPPPVVDTVVDVQVPEAAPPRTAPSPTIVTHDRVITGELAETLYLEYLDSVGPLAELAVLKHVDSRAEVLGYLANPRIDKIVVWQADRPVALGLVTNSLGDVTEISPAFLAARYPDHAARNAIYVGMLVLVSKHARGMSVFNRLYTELWQIPARDAGVLVFDVCEFNRTTFDADAYAERVASVFPRSKVELLDRQTWYVAELPEPLPDTATRR